MKRQASRDLQNDPEEEVGTLNPDVILLISGKRKSGKDFVGNTLRQVLADFALVFTIHISSPIKRAFAQTHQLDYTELMSNSPYKERYRRQMVEWSEQIREANSDYFCRLAVEEVQQEMEDILSASLAQKCLAAVVWIVFDVRRPTDIEFFNTEFSDSRLFLLRIEASEETRISRGWVFEEGLDDKETECALDEEIEEKGVKWTHVIKNDESMELAETKALRLEKQLAAIVSDVKETCSKIMSGVHLSYTEQKQV